MPSFFLSHLDKEVDKKFIEKEVRLSEASVRKVVAVIKKFSLGNASYSKNCTRVFFSCRLRTILSSR